MNKQPILSHKVIVYSINSWNRYSPSHSVHSINSWNRYSPSHSVHSINSWNRYSPSHSVLYKQLE